MAEEEKEDYIPPHGLGDLPRAIATERGELRGFDTTGRAPLTGKNKAADLVRQTDIGETLQTTRISPRPPQLLYGVESVYDARPIQGTDFQSSECLTISFFDNGFGDATFAPIESAFLVPENTIGS